MQEVTNWTYRADGEANFWTILDKENHWLGRIHLNGEFTVAQQEAVANLFSMSPAINDALGVALGLITKHGLAAELAKSDPDDFARLESARAAYIRGKFRKPEGRTVAYTSSFWARFDKLKATALETEDGKAFATAGFEFFHNGGGSTAWRKPLAHGRYIMVTNSHGDNHAPEGAGDSYMVGFYTSNDDVDGIVSDGHTLAANAIKAADYLAAMDQWEIAGRRAGWRSGDAPGQLIKNFAGATMHNTFHGDWKALCQAMDIEPEAAPSPAVTMEHVEDSFGIPEDWESPTNGIARVLRAVAHDFEHNGIPQSAIYDGNQFIGEVKITEAD